jgi:hypothetical protein
MRVGVIAISGSAEFILRILNDSGMRQTGAVVSMS